MNERQQDTHPASDLDALTRFFHARQNRIYAEDQCDEAKAALKLAKEAERKAADEIMRYVPERREEITRQGLLDAGLTSQGLQQLRDHYDNEGKKRGLDG